MFEKTSNILKHVANQKGFSKQANSARVCFEAQKVLVDIFGKSDNFEIVSFARGRLSIGAKNSIWAQEIQSKAQEIIDQINHRLKSGQIKKISFRMKRDKI
jgi:hypothetical protein